MIEARRAFLRYHATRTKGSPAWVACREAEVRGTTGPSHYRDMLAHGLGLQDPDMSPSAPSAMSPDVGRGLSGHSRSRLNDFCKFT